eukprot:s196_g33.t1
MKLLSAVLIFALSCIVQSEVPQLRGQAHPSEQAPQAKVEGSDGAVGVPEKELDTATAGQSEDADEVGAVHEELDAKAAEDNEAEDVKQMPSAPASCQMVRFGCASSCQQLPHLPELMGAGCGGHGPCSTRARVGWGPGWGPHFVL